MLPILPDIQLTVKPSSELKIKQEKRSYDSDTNGHEHDEFVNYDRVSPNNDTPTPPVQVVYNNNNNALPPLQSIPNSQQQPPKKIKLNHSDENSRDDDLLSTVVDYLRTENAIMDSDVAFGKMVGERLREIKKSKRNRLKIEITKLLYADSVDDEE